MRETFAVAIETLRGQDVDQYRVQQLVSQFEETLYDFPLRLPQDLALVVRVSTVLEGVCRTLVPEFDFVDEVTDYVRERGMGGEEGEPSMGERFARETVEEAGEQVQETARTLLSVPPKLNSVLGLVERENVRVNVVLDDSDALSAFGRKVVSGILLGGNLLAVALLYALENQLTAGVVALGVVPLAFLLYRTFRRKRGVRVRGDPQFTRQGLRARRGEAPGGEDGD
jgi:predicted unusual protein kinase regulating ubiquinone biosynthesis (AarF/ABC1/UbiB family)